MKNQVRAQIKILINQYKNDILSKFSTQTNTAVESLLKTKKIRTVACFASLPSEPNLWPLYKKMAAAYAGKQKKYRLVFPALNTVGFVHMAKISDLIESNFEMLKHVPADALVDLAEIELILVPGVAFDAKGNRLGRGGGYYDRVLAQLPPTTLKVGVCFPFQIVDEVPVESHDQKVDLVIS